MKVTVIYPKGSLNHGQASRNTSKVMTIDIPVEDNMEDIDICSVVWRYMNRVDGSTIEDQLNILRERSMMVGDIVQFNGKTFHALMVGWQRIQNENNCTYG